MVASTENVQINERKRERENFSQKVFKFELKEKRKIKRFQRGL